MPDEPEVLDFTSEAESVHIRTLSLEEKPYDPASSHVLDFTADEPQRILTLKEKDYDPEPYREILRGWLAAGLLGLVFIAVGAGIWFIYLGKLPGASLVESILPQVVTLAASALGFYFGGQQAIQQVGNARSRAIQVKQDSDGHQGDSTPTPS